MLKLRSMMENIAEKLFGRFLPEVEAQASCTEWEPIGCCGPFNGQWNFRRWCYPHQPPCSPMCTMCIGICPI